MEIAGSFPETNNPTCEDIRSDRLTRSLEIEAEQVDPGVFRVVNPDSTEGQPVRFVTTRPQLNCECPDAFDRDVVCKHLLAALREDGHQLVCSMVQEYERENEDA